MEVSNMDWGNILSAIFSPMSLLMMNIGLFAGIIIGALPGLNVVFAIAVLLPLTFGMDSIQGMYLLLGAYCGACYGGSISAILLNTPGTPAACATVFDGYPLAQKGRAGDALKIALVASVVGGVLSCLSLIFFAPQLAKMALSFQAPEYFALCIFGMSAAIGIAGEKIIKGLLMVILGLFLSTVGIDSTEGVQRFMFGNSYLLAGIKPVTVMLGIFALSEILVKSKEIVQGGQRVTVIKYQKASIRMKEIFMYWKTMLRSSAIGIIIGAIPGTGAAISAMMSYNEAKRMSKNPEEFGQGSVDGVVAPETGNNATTGATLIPLLTLGIPGDAAVAVLLGALTMQNIIPGPSLFSRDNIWVYCIMGGMLLINIFMFFQGSVFIRVLANVIKVPTVILLPCILMLSTIGSFAISNVVFDVSVMLVFGLLGYFMKTDGFPFPPLVISLVLGNFMETNLRRSLILSKGSIGIFFTRPICVAILVVAVLSLIYPIIKRTIQKAQMKNRAT